MNMEFSPDRIAGSGSSAYPDELPPFYFMLFTTPYPYFFSRLLYSLTVFS